MGAEKEKETWSPKNNMEKSRKRRTRQALETWDETKQVTEDRTRRGRSTETLWAMGFEEDR